MIGVKRNQFIQKMFIISGYFYFKLDSFSSAYKNSGMQFGALFYQVYCWFQLSYKPKALLFLVFTLELLG